MKAGTLWLNYENAAATAGISLRHFRRLFHDEKQGKSIKIGKKLFVLRADLENWMKQRRSA